MITYKFYFTTFADKLQYKFSVMCKIRIDKYFKMLYNV